MNIWDFSIETDWDPFLLLWHMERGFFCTKNNLIFGMQPKPDFWYATQAEFWYSINDFWLATKPDIWHVNP